MLMPQLSASPGRQASGECDLDGALDLSLPLRKRALSSGGSDDANDASQPSYKKSLIRRYCKCSCRKLCGCAVDDSA